MWRDRGSTSASAVRSLPRYWRCGLTSGAGSIGGLSAIVREVETIREFFASATISALVDVPFILLTLLVIGLIGGSVVWVPVILIPLVILVGFAPAACA